MWFYAPSLWKINIWRRSCYGNKHGTWFWHLKHTMEYQILSCSPDLSGLLRLILDRACANDCKLNVRGLSESVREWARSETWKGELYLNIRLCSELPNILNLNDMSSRLHGVVHEWRGSKISRHSGRQCRIPLAGRFSSVNVKTKLALS